MGWREEDYEEIVGGVMGKWIGVNEVGNGEKGDDVR